MNKFIKIDDDYINVSKIVKIEEDSQGDAIIFLSGLEDGEGVYETYYSTEAIYNAIKRIEVSTIQGAVKSKDKKTKKKAVNKFADIDVEGLF